MTRRASTGSGDDSPPAQEALARRARGPAPVGGEPVAAQQLVLGQAERGAGGAVGDLDAAVGVERDDQRRGAVERAAGAGARAAAGEVGGELAADRGEHRRDLGVGLAHVGRVELDHAEALVADGDREGGGGDQAGAQGLAGGSPSQTRAPERPHLARQALAGGEGLLAASRWSSAATGGAGAGGVPGGRAASAARRRGARRRRRVQPSDSPRVRQHALAQRDRLQPGGEMVGDRLLGGEQLVRAADAPAHPRLLELAVEHRGQLRGVGDRRHAGRQPAQDGGQRRRGACAARRR